MSRRDKPTVDDRRKQQADVETMLSDAVAVLGAARYPGLLLGSISETVLHRAGRPVVIVRER